MNILISVYIFLLLFLLRNQKPAVRGDTSGKVMKPARLAGTGYTLSVPDFVKNGDKIEIDTRTNEFKKRV